MDPVTVSAIVIGLLMAACSSPKESEKNVTPADAGSLKNVVQVDDILSKDSSTEQPDGDSIKPLDTYVPPDIAIDSVNDATPIVAPASNFPLKGKTSVFSQMPCNFINDLDDSGLGTCSGNGNRLFKLSESGQLTSVILPQFLDQVDQGPNGEIVITAVDTSNPPKEKSQGILFMKDFNATPKWIPFDNITLNGESFLPNFPKGIAFASGKIFVTTSNIEFGTDATPKKYYPGSVFEISYNGTIDQAIYTGGKNATSMGTWTHGELAYIAVVNTGYLNYNGDTKGEHSILTVLSGAPLSTEKTIKLPFGGLGIAGEISVSSAFMAIPSADNSGRIVLMNMQDLSKEPQIVMLPDAAGKSGAYLVSFAKIYGDYLIAGSYNSGNVSTWALNATPPTIVGNPIKMDTLSIGDAACIGGNTKIPCKLLITSGDKIMEIQ